MTAKIKLNAASGGGSIAINAPSSAGSDTDLLDTSGNLSLTGNCKVGTITDTSGNNSSTTAEIAEGRAKVWANINTETFAIRDSFNVSSIADAGSYVATLTYTTAFANGNYAVVCSCIQGTGGGATSRTPRVANPTRTTLLAGSVNVTSSDFSANNDEEAYIFVVCFGDQ